MRTAHAGFTKVTRDFSARRAVEAALMKDRQTPSGGPADRFARRHQAHGGEPESRAAHATECDPGVDCAVATVTGAARRRGRTSNGWSATAHLLAIADDVLEMSRSESGQMVISPGVRRVGPVVEEALAVRGAGRQRQADDHECRVWRSRGPAVLGRRGARAPDSRQPADQRDQVHRPRRAGYDQRRDWRRVTGATLGAWSVDLHQGRGTGRGIRPDHRRIFEPFQQSAVEDQRRGTGLGLSISRQLARVMGGDLIADSEAGRGSRLPCGCRSRRQNPCPAEQFQPFHRGTRSHWSAGTLHRAAAAGPGRRAARLTGWQVTTPARDPAQAHRTAAGRLLRTTGRPPRCTHGAAQ